MAIKIYEQFAPFANPADGDHPYGSFKNDSIPGAEDGTPLDAIWANDYAGSDAELFAQAGIVPSGQPDKLGASQRVDAMRAMFSNVGTVADIAAGKFNVGSMISVSDRAGGVFEIVAGGTANGFDILDAGAGKTAVLKIEGKFADVRHYGADGTQNADTGAFYRAYDKKGFVDLHGLTLNLLVSPRTIINKEVYIKNGKINFDSAGALTIPFIYESGNLLKFEDLHVLGDSNGSVNDSFNASAGTYSLVRAALIADKAAKNFYVINCHIERTQLLDDTKNGVTEATKFMLYNGEVTGCTFKDIPGHGIGMNASDSINIHHNTFINIGALCADFGAYTSNCKFEYNNIIGCSGIAKTQVRLNGGAVQIPINNSLSYNNATGITGGTGQVAACFKLSGINDYCVKNVINYDGQTGVESIEVLGSAIVRDNDITRTVNKSRGYIATLQTSSTTSVNPNPVVVIENNKGSGHFRFAYLRNTAAIKLAIKNNRPSSTEQLVFLDASVTCPSMTIDGNEIDSTSFAGRQAIQFSSSAGDCSNLKIVNNVIKSDSNCAIVFNADGSSIMGNTLVSVNGANIAIGATTSTAVVGNSSNKAWGTTSGQIIYGLNTIII